MQHLFLPSHYPSSFIQPLVLLSNAVGENYATGKTAIASSIAQYSLDEEDYDGILWIQDPDISVHNLEIFYQFLIKKLKKIHSLTYQFPEIHQLRAQSSHYYETILLDLLCFNKNKKYLLVIDNLRDFSILPAIKLLGIPSLITSRIRPLRFDGVIVEISRFTEDGYDILSPLPQRYSPPKWSLISAYLLGTNHNETNQTSPVKLIHSSQSSYEPTLALKLHAHLYCSISPIAARLYSTLRFLPANIFVPTQLIIFVFKLWLGNGNERAILDELIHYSLLQSSLDGDSILITKDSKSVLEVFCLPHHMSQTNDIHSELPLLEDITDRLSIALTSVSSFLLLELNSHPDCLIPLFEYLQWTVSDIFIKYNPLLETLLLTNDLQTAESFLKSLHEAFDGTPLAPQLSEVGSLESRDKLLSWIMQWSRKFVERFFLSPLDFSCVEHYQRVCSMMQFHATICQICHQGDESIAMRKKLVEYQRSVSENVNLCFGIALLSLGRAIFVTQSSGIGQIYSRSQNSVENVLVSVAKMAVKSLTKVDPTTSLGDWSLVFLVDVLELTGDNHNEAIGILETVLKLRNKFHETQLHPRVSTIYWRLYQIFSQENKWHEAFQSLNKSIRINRTLFGESHYMTSDLVHVLSDYNMSLGNHEGLQDLSMRLKTAHSPQKYFQVNVRGTKSPSDQDERSPSTPARRKIAEGGSLDDVALLIALAERITKKGDYLKSRKYLVKALQLIKHIMIDSDDADLPDPTLPLIFKWSAFHKLGELNVFEGEPLRAMKFYHRSYKGFLELSKIDIEHELQHLSEAVIVVYHLGTLVESVKGFQEAFPSYLEVLMILFDLYISSKTKFSKPLEVHISTVDHLYTVLFHHQSQFVELLSRLTTTIYQSPNNPFDLGTLKSNLSNAAREFWSQFMNLRAELSQGIPFPDEIPNIASAAGDFQEEFHAIPEPTIQIPLNVATEDRIASKDGTTNDIAASSHLSDHLPSAKEDETLIKSFPPKELVQPVFNDLSPSNMREFIPLPPKPPPRIARSIESPISPNLQWSSPYRRRGPRAIHIPQEDISDTNFSHPFEFIEESRQDSHEDVNSGNNFGSESVKSCESLLQVQGSPNDPEEYQGNPPSEHSGNNVESLLESVKSCESLLQVQGSPNDPEETPLSEPLYLTLVSPSDSRCSTESITSDIVNKIPLPSSPHNHDLNVAHNCHEEVQISPPIPDSEKSFQVEIPQQPRLSKKVSIKEIQEECTKFVNFFVFGSLRRHQENHSLLAMPNRDESFSYLGTTTTILKLYLYINSLTGLPIVTEEPISSKSTLTTIVGEVYSVTPSIVERAGSLFPDSTLVNIELESFGGKIEDNVAVMYLSTPPLNDDWINIPRGNYSQFLSARGGLEAFIAESTKKNRRKSINTADLKKLAEAFNEPKNPKQRRKYKIWD